MFESKEPGEGRESVPTVESSLACTVSYVRLAYAIGVKIDTLHGWVRQGKIRQPVYFGKLARWSEETARQILAEGVKPAGTYPPVDSPRTRQLAALPKNVTPTLGYQVTSGGPLKSRPKRVKKSTPKKKGKP